MIKKYFLSEGLENNLIIWKYGKVCLAYLGVCVWLVCSFFCNIYFSWRCYEQEFVRLKCRKSQVKMCLGTAGWVTSYPSFKNRGIRELWGWSQGLKDERLIPFCSHEVGNEDCSYGEICCFGDGWSTLESSSQRWCLTLSFCEEKHREWMDEEKTLKIKPMECYEQSRGRQW